MERRATAILLLMLSLVALLLAGAAFADDDTLRLPSDPWTPRVKEEWPWNCCDRLLCFLVLPPVCRCNDVVNKCDAACESCNKVESGGYVCYDLVPGPSPSDVPMPKPCNKP